MNDQQWNELMDQRQQLRARAGANRFRFLSRAHAADLFPRSILSFNTEFSHHVDEPGFKDATFFIDSDPHLDTRSFWRVTTGQNLCVYVGKDWNVFMWTGAYWQELETDNVFDKNEIELIAGASHR